MLLLSEGTTDKQGDFRWPELLPPCICMYSLSCPFTIRLLSTSSMYGVTMSGILTVYKHVTRTVPTCVRVACWGQARLQVDQNIIIDTCTLGRTLNKTPELTVVGGRGNRYKTLDFRWVSVYGTLT